MSSAHRELVYSEQMNKKWEHKQQQSRVKVSMDKKVSAGSPYVVLDLVWFVCNGKHTWRIGLRNEWIHYFSWKLHFFWIFRLFWTCHPYKLPQGRNVFTLNSKISSSEKLRSYTMVKYKKIPYPAEGFFRLYFFWSNQFQTSDIVLQPSFIQSFESWNFILLNGYNELQRDNKAHQWAKYTKPVQPWHPAQTSKQQWMCEQWITMQGGKKNMVCATTGTKVKKHNSLLRKHQYTRES